MSKRAYLIHEQSRYWYDDEDTFCESEESVEVNIERDLKINENNLDKELRNQAKLLGWYMQLSEEALAAKDQAKHAHAVLVQSHCDLIRIDEEKAELPKSLCLTETTLKRRVDCLPEVQVLFERLMQVTSTQRAMVGYVQAMTERGRMLQSMNKKQHTEFNQTK